MGILKRAVRRLKRVASSPPLPRGHYKDVWTALSESEGNAKLWVQGTEDEATLLESARNDLARIQRSAGVRPGDDIAEIGCGVGRLGTVLAPICRSWTGCDVSPNMLSHAARRLAAFDNVRFVELSGYDLAPLASSSLDLVYCTVVFMHLAEWDRYGYVEEAHRVLREGGRIFIDNISLTTDYGWKFFQESRRIPPSQRPPQIGSTSTPQEFEVYLRRAGFRDVRVDLVNEPWIVGTGVK